MMSAVEKILFVVPPYVSYESFVAPAFNDGTIIKGSKQYRNVATDMPIGLISMSAYLKKHIEINVTLLDFNVILHKLPNFDYASFVEMYKDVFVKNLETIEAPSIVGVTSLFSDRKSVV